MDNKTSIISNSHKRSKIYGVEKNRVVSKKIIKGEELKKTVLLNKKMISVSEPYMENIYKVVKDSGFMIVLTDKDGCILNIKGDSNILDEALKINMEVGAYMDEKSIGTNAMGTCIKENIPVQISATEHFINAYHRWTCSAAPIHDTNGRIIGSLNLTGNKDAVHSHTLGLVVAAVSSIENSLKIEYIENEIVKKNEKFKSKNRIKATYTFEDIIGESYEIKKVIKMAKVVADSPSTILIQGESGTGKEVLAQSIHNYSNRRENNFIAINCGAISKNLIESELFGYEEGSFTGACKGGKIGKFELANGGTIFLDEISEMPLDMQVNLLRVLQEGTVTRIGGDKERKIDVRIIAATNKDLAKEVSQGRFREDLYYRLSVIPLVIPPLRKRNGDKELLAKHFLNKKCNKVGKVINDLSYENKQYIKEYSWPGNVRELEHYIEKIVNLYDVEELIDTSINSEDEVNEEEIFNLDLIEELVIKKCYKKYNGNISKMSKALGIGRNTIYSKMKKYNIN